MIRDLLLVMIGISIGWLLATLWFVHMVRQHVLAAIRFKLEEFFSEIIVNNPKNGEEMIKAFEYIAGRMLEEEKARSRGS